MPRPIALSLNETWDYVLKDNREDQEEEQTVFHLRALSLKQRTKLQNMVSASSGDDEDTTVMQIAIGDRSLYSCEHGIAGWDNFIDGEGNEVEFRSVGASASRKSLEVIGSSDMAELSNEIVERSSLTKDQVGK